MFTSIESLTRYFLTKRGLIDVELYSKREKNHLRNFNVSLFHFEGYVTIDLKEYSQ